MKTRRRADDPRVGGRPRAPTVDLAHQASILVLWLGISCGVALATQIASSKGLSSGSTWCGFGDILLDRFTSWIPPNACDAKFSSFRPASAAGRRMSRRSSRTARDRL